MMRSKLLLATASLPSLAASAEAEAIQIGIGHQSMCTDTYTAGIVIKELKLLEKHLPQTGKYKDAQYEITWSDYSSGGPITNQMLANKLNIRRDGRLSADRQRRQVPGDQQPAQPLRRPAPATI